MMMFCCGSAIGYLRSCKTLGGMLVLVSVGYVLKLRLMTMGYRYLRSCKTMGGVLVLVLMAYFLKPPLPLLPPPASDVTLRPANTW